MNQNFLKEDLLQDSQTERISFVGLRSGSSAYPNISSFSHTVLKDFQDVSVKLKNHLFDFERMLKFQNLQFLWVQ